MSPDPGVDRPLDTQIVRAVLREQFPELAGNEVAYLDEGYDHQVYRVGAGWLFRFPKRAQVVPWLQREMAVLHFVEPVIGVPVPRFEKHGRPSDAFPYPFVGYRELAGVAADDVDGFDHSDVARGLGGALTRLHSLDTGRIPPAPEVDDAGEPLRFRGGRDVMKAIPERIRDEVAMYVGNEVPCPPFPGPSRVVHNDILPEHVLIDPATGGLAGIIDFADLWIGDPAGDLTGLVSIGGYEFVDEVIANYELAIDEWFVERIRWRARVLHLEWLENAVTEGRDVAEYQRLLAVAFAAP